MEITVVKDAIHAFSSALEVPAIIVLIAMVVLTVYQLGSAIVEYFMERAGKRLDVTRALDAIAGLSRAETLAALRKLPFLKSQQQAFARLLENREMPVEEQRIFAGQLLADEEARLERRVHVTDVIARIAPMFGLMATLIPLGPGLIALGQGDTKQLADSLLTAFDATVAGLCAAGVAFVISKVRKRWYQGDLTAMETILEGVIE